MKDNLDAALAFTLQEEGGYSNNPRDPGGRTYKGITQRTYDAFRRNADEKTQDVRSVSDDELDEIYQRYWDAVQADTLPSGVDLVMFDIAVMSGPSRANDFYQHGAHSIDLLNQAHLSFLQHLTTFPTFGNGWTKRVNARQAAATSLAAKPIAPAPTPARPPQSVPTPDSGVVDTAKADAINQANELSRAIQGATADLNAAVAKFHATPLVPVSDKPSDAKPSQAKGEDMNPAGILGTIGAIFSLVTTVAPKIPNIVGDVDGFVSDIETVMKDIENKDSNATFADLEKAFGNVQTDWSDVTTVLQASSKIKF